MFKIRDLTPQDAEILAPVAQEMMAAREKKAQKLGFTFGRVNNYLQK